MNSSISSWGATSNRRRKFIQTHAKTVKESGHLKKCRSPNHELRINGIEDDEKCRGGCRLVAIFGGLLWAINTSNSRSMQATVSLLGDAQVSGSVGDVGPVAVDSSVCPLSAPDGWVRSRAQFRHVPGVCP